MEEETQLVEYDFICHCTLKQAEELYRVITELCNQADIVMVGGFYPLEELIREPEG